MAVPAKPMPGQPAMPTVLDAETWSTLLDIVAKWRQGDFGPGSVRSRRKGVVMGKNTGGAELAKGTIQQLGAIQDPGEANVQPLHEYKPTVPLLAPVWNSAMDQLVIVPTPIAAGEVRAVGSNQYVPVTLSSAPGVYKWCHIDPDTPTQLKAGTGGPFKIVGTFANNVAVIDTEELQPIWQYRIKTDDDLDDVELQNLDGTVFANTIKLLFIGDPPTVKADDVGMCTNVGNDFYAQAGFTCESLCDCEDYLPASPNICPDP